MKSGFQVKSVQVAKKPGKNYVGNIFGNLQH
jgi:hypothetical protein